jgi:DNA replication protein DnaC
VEEFDGNIASFIFSGKPGTGKNHLAPPSATNCCCAGNRS